jgi:hypothetical protein
MSKYYSGRDGALYYGDGATSDPVVKVGRVTRWAFQTQMATLDTTSLGDTETTVIPSLRTHTGTATVLYYTNDLGGNKASQLLSTLLKPRLDPELPRNAADPQLWRIQLRVDENATDFKRIQGPIWITAANMSMAVGEIFAIDFSFTFFGAPVTVTI